MKQEVQELDHIAYVAPGWLIAVVAWMSGLVAQFSQLVCPFLHMRRQDSTVSQVIDFGTEIGTVRVLFSHHCLNSAASHDGRRIPVLVRVASMSLEPESADRLRPVFWDALSAKRPRQGTETVQPAAEVAG